MTKQNSKDDYAIDVGKIMKVIEKPIRKKVLEASSYEEIYKVFKEVVDDELGKTIHDVIYDTVIDVLQEKLKKHS